MDQPFRRAMPASRLVHVAVVLVASLGAVAAAQSSPRARVRHLEEQAMVAFSQLDLDNADTLIAQALELATRAHVDGNDLARVHMARGVIAVAGHSDTATGLEAFALALEADPSVVPDPATNTPEVQAVFDTARGRAGIGAQPSGGGATTVSPRGTPGGTSATTVTPATTGGASSTTVTPPATSGGTTGTTTTTTTTATSATSSSGTTRTGESTATGSATRDATASSRATRVGTARPVASSSATAPPASEEVAACSSNDECAEDERCSAGRCVDAVGRPRVFLQGGGVLGLYRVQSGMPTDDTPPSGYDPTKYASYVPDGTGNCHAGAGSYCVRVASPGFAPVLGIRAMIGYWLSPRWAIAAGARVGPGGFHSPFSFLLTTLRMQVLLTNPNDAHLHVSMFFGASFGQVQVHPKQPSGVVRPWAQDGLGSFQVGVVAGYRFLEHLGVFVQIDGNAFFPHTSFGVDGTVGPEISF